MVAFLFLLLTLLVLLLFVNDILIGDRDGLLTVGSVQDLLNMLFLLLLFRIDVSLHTC